MRLTRTKPFRFAALTLALITAQMLSGAHASETAVGPAAVPTAADTTAQVPSGSSVDADSEGLSATTASSSQQTPRDISTLTQLIQQGRVTPLRSTVAGSYSATLSFSGEDLTYYIALLHQDTYWRVFATQNKKWAEAVYARFVARTEHLAVVEDRRAELAAQEAAIQRLIEQEQIKAQQLQADAQIAQAQRDEVATQQMRATEQVKNLKAEDQEARKQLTQIRHQIIELQIASNWGLPSEYPARLRKDKRPARRTGTAASATVPVRQ